MRTGRDSPVGNCKEQAKYRGAVVSDRSDSLFCRITLAGDSAIIVLFLDAGQPKRVALIVAGNADTVMI
jgi:hypothetical protein